MLMVGKSPPLLSKEDSIKSPLTKTSSLRQSTSEMYAGLTRIIVYISTFLLALLNYFPSWLVPRLHRPYDAIYASLPPIATFSEFSSSKFISNPLSIAYEVWRPNPQWTRKSCGPPDFHVCVLNGREKFPSFAQLELLYNSVAKKHPLGGRNGKIVLAVVDCGVSNYMTLDENLLAVSTFELES